MTGNYKAAYFYHSWIRPAVVALVDTLNIFKYFRNDLPFSTDISPIALLYFINPTLFFLIYLLCSINIQIEPATSQQKRATDVPEKRCRDVR